MVEQVQRSRRAVFGEEDLSFLSGAGPLPLPLKGATIPIYDAMMVSLLGTARQALQALFLVRYLLIRPVWAALKTAALYPTLNALLSLLVALGNRDIPLE